MEPAPCERTLLELSTEVNRDVFLFYSFIVFEAIHSLFAAIFVATKSRFNLCLFLFPKIKNKDKGKGAQGGRRKVSFLRERRTVWPSRFLTFVAIEPDLKRKK